MISVFVAGVPGPQGSKSFKGMRKGKKGQPIPILAESSAKVAPWRDAVTRAMIGEGQHISGAIHLMLEFVMTRVQSEPKGWTRHHTKTPDLDKLIRSTCDAISTSGAWEDDSRICRLDAIKRTAEPGEPTGCFIAITTLPLEKAGDDSPVNLSPLPALLIAVNHPVEVD